MIVHAQQNGEGAGESPGERRVVIVGGGFAGVTVARLLERRLPKSWEVFLLSRSNQLTYNPLLPEVVGGALLPGHAVAPLRLMLPKTRIRMVTVNAIDPLEQSVSYTGVVNGCLRYDHLVLATGMAAHMDTVPGMAAHALPLKTLGDALHLRNRVLHCMEEATLTNDPDRRAWLMTFVVVGGGFSGVETAGEIMDFAASAYRFYRNLKRNDVRVVLLHSGPRLLPELSAGLGKYTVSALRRRGIEVRLNTRASIIEHGTVRLHDGGEIIGATIVSTIGVTAHRFIRDSPLPTQRGRLIADPDLRVAGFDDIWALGDCATITNASDALPCPPTAQFAVRQANTVAANIIAKLRGSAPAAFRYQPIGQIASIGHHRAVAQIYRFRIHGIAAWLLWRAVYLLKMPTIAGKVRLFIEWTLAMFFPRDLGCLDFERTAATLSPAATRCAPHNGRSADAL